jgi:DNA-binding NtrC family response regulator
MAATTVTRRFKRFLRVDTLAATVVRGPDAGATVKAEHEVMTIGSANGNDLVLTDETVSRFHLELVRDPNGVRVVDLGSTNGTRAGGIQIERATVPPGTELELGATRLRIDGGDDVAVELHGADALGDLRGATSVMRRLMARIVKVAASNAPVLLIGESGTGKELIARAIHENSPRADAPFVTVDCGAMSRSLVSSELFGHERGAFTGADHQHLGAFERADGGTLFLDEIGELPPELQSYLLGALERGQIQRLGGREPIRVDVRVVSATNRDLRAEVNEGKFRLDLFYRVAVALIEVPPLRDHADDIPMLIEHFAKDMGSTLAFDQVIQPSELERLRTYRWPGNVRELRNRVEAAIVMGERMVAPAGGGPSTDDAPDLEAENELTYREARARAVGRFERRYLSALLERAGGNVSQAARLAKMNRSHLSEMLHRNKLK